MAALTKQQVEVEVSNKGFTLTDASQYKNLSSPITVRCNKGHLFNTTLNEVRAVSFCCPQCESRLGIKISKTVPVKQLGTRRIIAFDQATENFGLSIFDNGELVFCQLYRFSGDVMSRLVKIRKFLQDIVISGWKPDRIIMEDIQFQVGNYGQGVLTFKILAMLFGIIQELMKENNIPCEAVAPNVWRKYAGTCGKNRQEEKVLSKALVKKIYGIDVIDDVAESILIGRYAVKTDHTSIYNTHK